MTATAYARTPGQRTALRATLVGLLFAATLLLFWNGVGANDSDKYVRYALALLDGESWLGRDHWALRLLLVAPIAASFAAFGVSEFTSTIPNILCAAGLIGVTFVFTSRHLSASAATAVTALVASSSFLVVVQSEVAIAGPELLAGVIACWLFYEGAIRRIDLKRIAAAGVAAGLAFYCREVAVYLPITFGLFLLFQQPRRLDAMLALSAGFALIVGGELIVYAALTGDPFYRLAIDFSHRGPGDFFELPLEAPANPAVARLTLPLQYVLTAPTVTPFAVISAILVAYPRTRRRLLQGEFRKVAGLFLAAAAVSFVFSAYFANLKLPDYYPMVSYAALLAIGIIIGSLIDDGAARAGGALLAGLILLNWATADFRRYGEYDEARRLADHVSESGASVITDPATAARTRLMLRLRGFDRPTADSLALSLKYAPRPLCGLIYSATPGRAERAIRPEPGWTLVWSQEVRKTRWTVAALRALAPGIALSQQGRRVLRIVGPVALYDAGDCALEPKPIEVAGPNRV